MRQLVAKLRILAGNVSESHRCMRIAYIYIYIYIYKQLAYVYTYIYICIVFEPCSNEAKPWQPFLS